MAQGIAGDQPQSLNREELVQLGIQTARSGNRQSARVIFQRVLAEDPRHERALLWMAYLARDKVEKRRFLLKALKANPNNSSARQELQRMARAEKVRTNRTLLLGGFVVVVMVLLIVLVVLVAVALSTMA